MSRDGTVSSTLKVRMDRVPGLDDSLLCTDRACDAFLDESSQGGHRGEFSSGRSRRRSTT